MRRRRAVEFVFERYGQRFVSCGVRARQTGWRHHARAQLAHHFFPLLGVLANVREIQLVEHQARGLQFLVVTGDAVLIENGALRKQRTRGLAPGHRGREQKYHSATHVFVDISKVLESQGGGAFLGVAGS